MLGQLLYICEFYSRYVNSIADMSELALDIAEFISMAKKKPVIDVRTPAEFYHGHIPGAFNLPLFSNEERSVIGTLYLKKGSSEAITRGLEFIRPKMKVLADSGHAIAPQGEALMHCWRGGMRSSSMAWLMNSVGVRTYTLKGGYKSFRRYTTEVFSRPLNLVVIGGMTGTGKTAVIKSLRSKGKQVIDLEGLAGHRGSVFGGIGLPDQPSTEQFENNLFDAIVKLDPLKPIYIEDESLSIGKVFIPRSFHLQMANRDFILLNLPFEKRVSNLVVDYSTGNKDDLAAAVRRIEKRLGTESSAKAEMLIYMGRMEESAEIILRYYDKVYARSMEHKRRRRYDINIDKSNPGEIAEMIISKTE